MDKFRPSEPNYINLEYFFDKFFTGVRIFVEKSLLLAEWLRSDGFKIFSITLSIVFFIGILYVIRKFEALNKKKTAIIREAPKKEDAGVANAQRWDIIAQKIKTDNPSDWKIAIIEADTLIDEIMKNVGHEGADLGERLKSVEASDFENLQNVWDAHKVRNRIAHDAGYQLTKEDAEDAIERYKKALKELKYI